MLRDDDPRLAPLLTARAGVVRRRDLAAAGLDPRLLDRRTTAGTWTSIAPSIAVAAPVPSLEQRCLAALDHTGPPAAVTARAACVLLRLRDVPPVTAVEVVVPHGRRLISTAAVRVVRTRLRTPLVRVRGMPVVTVPRAVRDASSGLPLQDVRALVLAAVADGHVSVEELEQQLGAGRLPGRALLRRALRDAALGAASAPEAELHDLVGSWLRRQGLEVLLNPWLLVGETVLCRPDLYVPSLGRGFEVDSVEHHGDGPALTRTLQRHDRAEDAGVSLRHVTPWEVRQQPRQVLERVQRHLSSGSPPAGVEVRRHDDPPPWVRPRR